MSNILVMSTTQGSITTAGPNPAYQIRIVHWVLSDNEIALASTYCFICSIGLFGNVLVLRMLVTTMWRTRKKIHNSSIWRSWLMLLSLSCVDTISLISLIPNVIKTLSRSWLLGSFLCRLTLSFDSYTKLMSTYIIAALSADRYSIICCNGTPTAKKYVRALIVFMICVTATFTVLITAHAHLFYIPLLIYTDSPENISFNPVYECQLNLGQFQTAFSICIMTFGYVIPGLLLAYFYASILCKTFKQGKRFNTIHVWKVTRTIILVAIVYYIFWTPYWIVTVLLASINIHTPPVVAYVIHAFPFVTSAINPVVYSLLNKELWRAYKNNRFAKLKRDFKRQFGIKRGHERHERHTLFKRTTCTAEDTSFTPLVFETLANTLNINLMMVDKRNYEVARANSTIDISANAHQSYDAERLVLENPVHQRHGGRLSTIVSCNEDTSTTKPASVRNSQCTSGEVLVNAGLCSAQVCTGSQQLQIYSGQTADTVLGNVI